MARPAASVEVVLDNDRDVVFLQVLNVRLGVDARKIIRELVANSGIRVAQPACGQILAGPARSGLRHVGGVKHRDHHPGFGHLRAPVAVKSLLDQQRLELRGRRILPCHRPGRVSPCAHRRALVIEEVRLDEQVDAIVRHRLLRVEEVAIDRQSRQHWAGDAVNYRAVGVGARTSAGNRR